MLREYIKNIRELPDTVFRSDKYGDMEECPAPTSRNLQIIMDKLNQVIDELNKGVEWILSAEHSSETIAVDLTWAVMDANIIPRRKRCLQQGG